MRYSGVEPSFGHQHEIEKGLVLMMESRSFRAGTKMRYNLLQNIRQSHSLRSGRRHSEGGAERRASLGYFLGYVPENLD